MMEVLSGLFSFGVDVFSVLALLLLASVAGLTAWVKGRNVFIWGVLTFFLPYMIILLFFLPRRVPKFRSYLKNTEGFKDNNPAIASIMALSAIVAKADGHVSKKEVALIQKFVTSTFRISKSELAKYQRSFDYGKEHPDEYEEFIRIIQLYHRNRQFSISLSYLLLTLGLDEGRIGVKEEQVIKKIVVGFGLSEHEYQSLKIFLSNGGFSSASYAGGQGFNGSQGRYGSSGYFNNGVNQANLTQKYAKVLGIDQDADLTTIKKAYRKLAKEYHPDKMAAQGMPDEYMEYANERISEINEAYEYMKKRSEASQQKTSQYV